MARSAAAATTKGRGQGPVRVEGRGALKLDRVIHERTRLAIVSALAATKSATFSELKHLLEMTDGNLSVHARKLEEAGYVKTVKTFEGRIPRTTFSLTVSGRRAFENYLAHMESLIQAART